MTALKTLVFSIFVPGSVAGLFPWLITHNHVSAYSPWTLPWVLGLIPMTLGAALYFWCAAHFTFKGKGTPLPADPPKDLVVSGPYRWVRNPMYVAVLSLVFGEALLVQSLWLVAYGVIAFAVVQLFVVLYEEPKLASLFGEQYADYKSKVYRWLPRPPRS